MYFCSIEQEKNYATYYSMHCAPLCGIGTGTRIAVG